MRPTLEGRGLSKAYCGVSVVSGVDIAVDAGEIRAVIGENGAGKSTLMNMLVGVTRPDAGEITVRGRLMEFSSPRSAAKAGIAIVHQELHLVPFQSVTDNLMLMRPPSGKFLRRGTGAEYAFVRSAIARVGLDVDPQTSVYQLSLAQSQLLEIAKALILDAAVIIFDEPTAALQPVEAEQLLKLVETLRVEGKAILYISHALDEVLRLANRISVLRDGRLVGDWDRAQVDREALIRAMVDRPVGLYTFEPPRCRAEVVLKADRIATAEISDLGFELQAGEILGFAGLMGGGMQEAALALCGEQRIKSGRLILNGRIEHFRSPRDAARAGIALIPEERKAEGIVPQLSVLENLHLGRYRSHAWYGFVNPRSLRRAAAEVVRRFQVRLASIDQPISTLSGGNQQKVLLARSLQGHPRVLIIASPTRGVDIGAKDAIHRIILDLAERGTAVILLSPEVEELLALSHRIAVFGQRRLKAILNRDEASPTRILQLAIGTSPSLLQGSAHAA